MTTRDESLRLRDEITPAESARYSAESEIFFEADERRGYQRARKIERFREMRDAMRLARRHTALSAIRDKTRCHVDADERHAERVDALSSMRAMMLCATRPQRCDMIPCHQI